MAKRKHINYPMGSVSTCTMRPEDLIPSFVYEIETHLRRGDAIKGHYALIRGINARMRKGDYYDSEDSLYDLESLFDAMGEYSAPYFYFGAHPGDGSDYGYWLCEDFQEDFDGLTVSDTSEVPTTYRGEVLHINERGNVTLYVKTNSHGDMREIWGVV